MLQVPGCRLKRRKFRDDLFVVLLERTLKGAIISCHNSFFLDLRVYPATCNLKPVAFVVPSIVNFFISSLTFLKE